jgi:hypothetical protein
MAMRIGVAFNRWIVARADLCQQRVFPCFCSPRSRAGSAVRAAS